MPVENHAEKLPDGNFIKLSEMIANPLIKVYKAGQLGLVFIFIGLVLIVFAQTYSSNKYSSLSFALGAILIFVSFLLFLFLQLTNPTTKSKNIVKGKEVIDNLQELSINLVVLTGELQAFSFKYINDIDNVLTIGMPYIQNIPFISENLKGAGLKAKNIQASVVDFGVQSKKVIREVERALVTSDVKKFKGYVQEIEKLSLQINNYLKK